MQVDCQHGVVNKSANGISECIFSAKGAAFIASPPQDGFAVANLGQNPRNPIALDNQSTESARELNVQFSNSRRTGYFANRTRLKPSVSHRARPSPQSSPRNRGEAEWCNASRTNRQRILLLRAPARPEQHIGTSREFSNRTPLSARLSLY